MSTTQYRYIGTHAQILEGGMPIAPGDYVDIDITTADGITQMLLDDGKLIDATGYVPATATTEHEAPPQTTKSTRAKEGEK